MFGSHLSNLKKIRSKLNKPTPKSVTWALEEIKKHQDMANLLNTSAKDIPQWAATYQEAINSIFQYAGISAEANLQDPNVQSQQIPVAVQNIQAQLPKVQEWLDDAEKVIKDLHELTASIEKMEKKLE